MLTQVPSPGVYETDYGNAATWVYGDFAYDLDMAEAIPIEFVNFNRWLRPVEDFDTVIDTEEYDIYNEDMTD